MPEPRILVTGGTGQVASALAADPSVVRVGRPDFDFDRPETISAVVNRVAPTLIVNTAAYTAVDAAETDADAAYRRFAESGKFGKIVLLTSDR